MEMNTNYYLNDGIFHDGFYIFYCSLQNLLDQKFKMNFKEFERLLNQKFLLFNNIYEELIFHSKEIKDVQKLNEIFKETLLLTIHKQRIYNFEKFEFDRSPSSKISNGQTFIEFYSEKYSIQIQNLSQPIIKCTKENVFLIPELCKRTYIDYNEARLIYKSITDLFKYSYDLIKFQRQINIQFEDQEILQNLFDLKENQRLEYLGDSILEFFVSEYVFETFPNANENEMNILKQLLIKNDTLNELGNKLNIKNLIKGNIHRYMIADVLESIIAGIYLDQGIQKVKEFIHYFILKDAKILAGNTILNQSFNDKTIILNHEIKEKLKLFQNMIGIKFKNQRLLYESLCDINECNKMSYKRLKFLGESVLKFIVNNHLFHLKKDLNEHEMTNLLNDILNQKNLLKIGDELKLNNFIFTFDKKRNSKMIKIRVLKSIIGAIYYEYKFECLNEFDIKHRFIHFHVINNKTEKYQNP